MRLRRKATPQAPGRHRQQTSWQAPAAYSYHAQRAARDEIASRQPVSLAQKRGRLMSVQQLAQRSGYILAIGIGIICAVSLLSVSSQPRINLLDQGNTYAFQDKNRYAQAVSKQLTSSVWNRNKVTVNTGAVADQLRSQFPELATVRVVLPLIGHRPIVYLGANAPAYVLQSSAGSFVLDAHGKALVSKDGAPEATVNTLPVITDQTGVDVSIGKQVISGANADFIQTVIKTLASKQQTVSTLTFPSGSAQELDITVQGKPYTIKFDMHDSGGVRQQVGTYLATAATLDGQKITPSQYIDARVLGRAYYQ